MRCTDLCQGTSYRLLGDTSVERSVFNFLFVIGQKISNTPIIGQLDAVETVVGKHSGHFLEVIDFLLFPGKLLVVNALKFHVET